MKILDETKSLCPKCLQLVPAKITTDEKRVFIEKTCERDGISKALLWSDLNLYTRTFRFSRPGKPAKPNIEGTNRGCPFDCGLCPSHKQHTCLAIVEVTDACNLLCPVCLADSKVTPTCNPSLEDFETMFRELLRCEGRPTAIQFSGGEPTVRKDLLEIIGLAQSLGFKLIEIDTNGIELAKDPNLARDLADLGISGVYLQFDGVTPETHMTIRGMDLTKIKEEAVKNCIRAGLSVTLAMTVIKRVNDSQLGDVVKYAISRGAIGVNFQPFTAVGRYPQNLFDPLDRTTVSDIQLEVEKQSGGQVKATDFMPVPCPDPRCSSLVYAYYRNREELNVINRLADLEQLIDKYDLKNRFVEFDDMLKAIADELAISDAFKGNIRLQAMGSSLRLLLEDLKPEGFFSIGCHFAQDAWTVDIKRLSKCCVHELREKGKLVPFCLYNLTSSEGKKLYRNSDLYKENKGVIP